MINKHLLPLCLLALLLLPVACKEEKAATVDPNDPATLRSLLPGEEKLPYHASSDIDGWQLSVTPEQIMLERTKEAVNIVLPKPEIELLTGGYKYRLPTTPKVTTIVVKHVECKDGAGNSYPDTVEIDDSAGKTTGCGGPVGQQVAEADKAPVASSSLENIEWKAVEIKGQPVSEDVVVSLQLDGAGRAAGKGGCNRYSGPYESGDNQKISFSGAMIATKMACMGAGGEIEQTYFATLAEVQGYRFEDGGFLVLTDKDGKDVLRFKP